MIVTNLTVGTLKTAFVTTGALDTAKILLGTKQDSALNDILAQAVVIDVSLDANGDFVLNIDL